MLRLVGKVDEQGLGMPATRAMAGTVAARMMVVAGEAAACRLPPVAREKLWGERRGHGTIVVG